MHLKVYFAAKRHPIEVRDIALKHINACLNRKCVSNARDEHDKARNYTGNKFSKVHTLNCKCHDSKNNNKASREYTP